MIQNTKILVVGCGRSGTLYMSKVLSYMGLDVRHEKLGADGICSWFHSFGNRQKRIIQSKLKQHNILCIHLVRNPIDVINSMYRVTGSKSRRALQYFKDICPDETEGFDGMRLAMLYWVFWNKQTEIRGINIDIRIRVEDLNTESNLKCLCGLFEVKYSRRLLADVKRLGNKIHSSNQKDKQDMSFAEMKNLDLKLATEIATLANRYGYKIDE